MSMGKLIAGAVAAVMLLTVGSCNFERVTSGHVGVKVQNIGSGSGVSPKPLEVGWYFTPPGTTIYEYPIYTNNYTYQKVAFQDKSGLSIDADVAVAYLADPGRAPVLFQKYRVDMDSIVLGAMRNAVRDAIVREASTMPVESIYGEGKAKLIEAAQARVQKRLGKFGLNIESLSWASNIRLPRTIQAQINARVANEQEALAAQAAVATAEAQGRARVAAAEAKAKALRAEQEALTNAPQVLELRAIEKWNGQLPATMVPGSAVPFLGKLAG